MDEGWHHLMAREARMKRSIELLPANFSVIRPKRCAFWTTSRPASFARPGHFAPRLRVPPSPGLHHLRHHRLRNRPVQPNTLYLPMIIRQAAAPPVGADPRVCPRIRVCPGPVSANPRVRPLRRPASPCHRVPASESPLWKNHSARDWAHPV
jgi:hypothetical protein